MLERFLEGRTNGATVLLSDEEQRKLVFGAL